MPYFGMMLIVSTSGETNALNGEEGIVKAAFLTVQSVPHHFDET